MPVYQTTEATFITFPNLLHPISSFTIEFQFVLTWVTILTYVSIHAILKFNFKYSSF